MFANIMFQDIINSPLFPFTHKKQTAPKLLPVFILISNSSYKYLRAPAGVR